MKYLIVLSLIAAVASAGYLKPALVSNEVAEIQEIIAAINSPSTDPATAAALEQLLLDTLGISPAPAPVLVEEPAPISIGPAIIDFPLHDGGAITPGLTPVQTPAPVEAPIVPAPAVVPEAAAAPLVQIILNINQASDVAAVAPSPAETPVIVESPVDVAPVNIVDEAVNVEGPSPIVIVDNVPEPIQVVDNVPEPIQVVEVAPEPIQVVDNVPEPIQVVDNVPEPTQVVEVAPEPIQVVEIAPAPVVTLPDVLN